jgi:hypothetical protein
MRRKPSPSLKRRQNCRCVSRWLPVNPCAPLVQDIARRGMPARAVRRLRIIPKGTRDSLGSGVDERIDLAADLLDAIFKHQGACDFHFF